MTADEYRSSRLRVDYKLSIFVLDQKQSACGLSNLSPTRVKLNADIEWTTRRPFIVSISVLQKV